MTRLFRKENRLFRKETIACCCVALSLAAASNAIAQTPAYDLLLQGGHILDDKNHIDSVMDVAIKDGKVAKVAAHIPSGDALKTINAKGLYVTPGLIDIHVHVYAGTGERGSYAGNHSSPPDAFTFRVGVTTVVDAGCAGWKNFEDFKQRLIDRKQHVRLVAATAWRRGDDHKDSKFCLPVSSRL